MNKIIYFTLINLFICLHLQAQKPKKIFNYLLENNLNLAIEEYEKIQADKEYDDDDKKLFEIANCLFLINKSYTKYNPILSINYFNRIKNDLNTSTKQEQIFKFLAKHDFTFEKISDQIHAEIYQEAKNLNTVESYSNALEVCSVIYRMELLQLKEEAFFQRTLKEQTISSCKTFLLNYANSNHKTEIEYLLERMLLNTAKRNQSLVDLNSFISEYPSSKLKQEAIDYRDSIVLLNVPNDYKAMSAYIKEYPNSKFNKEVLNKLPDLLYNECVKLNTIESCRMFINEYPDDIRVSEINILLSDKLFFECIKLNTTASLEQFVKEFPNNTKTYIAKDKLKQKNILSKLIGEHSLISVSKSNLLRGFDGANLFFNYWLNNEKWNTKFYRYDGDNNDWIQKECYVKLNNEILNKLKTLKILISNDLEISILCNEKEYFKTSMQADGLSYYLRKITNENNVTFLLEFQNIDNKSYTTTFIDEYFYFYIDDKVKSGLFSKINVDEFLEPTTVILKYNTNLNQFELCLYQDWYAELKYIFK